MICKALTFFEAPCLLNPESHLGTGVLQNHRPPTTDHPPSDKFSTDPPTTDSPAGSPPTHRSLTTDHQFPTPTTDSPTLLELTTNPLTHQTYFSRCHYWSSSFINQYQLTIQIGYYLLLNSLIKTDFVDHSIWKLVSYSRNIE